jgi:transcriptional regulator with XRE-family HTH domain
MKEETVLAEEGFSRRLTQLRSERNVSAREMSLSLGQAAGYINSIENGNSLPSMSMFFEICEYLQITPRDFFAYTAQERPLPFIEVIRNLPEEEQYLLLALARKLGKG